METIAKKCLNAFVVIAALSLNAACADSGNASVWSNSDYGAGTTSTPYIKNVSGLSLLN